MNNKITLCAFADEADKLIVNQIDALLGNNINLLEIRGVDGTNIADITLDKAKELRVQFDNSGIKVWSIGSPLGKVNVDVDFDEYLKKVEHVCKIANILQAKQIRCFSFFKAYNDREKVLEYMQKMVDVGSKYGVFMCHENEKDIYGDTLERTVDILDNVKGIKCVYDPANFLQVGESDSNKTLDALHSRAHYFHIKDVISATGELVPAGEGDGNIDKLVANIKDDKVLTLEPHLAIFDSYKSFDDNEMKNKYLFRSNEEAFDCAVNSRKKILIKNGYKEIKGAFVK